MTKIKMQMEAVVLPETKENTQMLCLTVAGHAGYAPKGQDIVCAAESVLVQALAGALTQLDKNFLYDFTVDGTPGGGAVGITAVPTPRGWDRVWGMFETTMMGYSLLQQAFPHHVAVEKDSAGEELFYAG